MGSSLRRDLREVLPASIKGLQRAIALEIADDARYDDAWRYDPEKGRRSKVRMAELVRWTGAKDELSVREMLRRLAVAGWEFRVPIGKGKDGRPLYAVPGQAMQFRVPDFKGPTTVGPSDETEQEGPTVVAQGPTLVGEGPTTVGEGPTVVVEGPTTVGSPSPIPPSSSHRYPTSSPAEIVPDAPAVIEEDGGGGGSLDTSRSTAIYIAGALDYRGKPPTQQQRQTIVDRLTAALAGGWTLDGLALYLDLGDAPVQSPAAVYLHRLKPGVLPDAEPLDAPQRPRGGIREELPTAEEYASLTLADVLGDEQPDPVPAGRWGQAVARARSRLAGAGGGGTDDRVAGWGAVARQLDTHRPYSNDAWSTAAIEAEAVKIPHCGELDCDEKTRMRDGRDHNDLPYVSPCPKCHPRMQW